RSISLGLPPARATYLTRFVLSGAEVTVLTGSSTAGALRLVPPLVLSSKVRPYRRAGYEPATVDDEVWTVNASGVQCPMHVPTIAE
ncbi:MAG: hypothetical protein WCD13_09690, partial [Pseudolabrys sp.]